MANNKNYILKKFAALLRQRKIKYIWINQILCIVNYYNIHIELIENEVYVKIVFIHSNYNHFNGIPINVNSLLFKSNTYEKMIEIIQNKYPYLLQLIGLYSLVTTPLFDREFAKVKMLNEVNKIGYERKIINQQKINQYERTKIQLQLEW